MTDRSLPTGTVTFVFTDVEGSTRLLEELGDEYAAALEEHRRALRSAIAAHGGVEVDTQGDAFFAVFASARDAVAAAVEAQGALELPVRMGLHTAEATVAGDGYVGIDVHRAARICSAAHGGQVLLSQTTRDLVDASIRDLGEHRLRDLSQPQRLYQLLVEGMTLEFPPLRTLERHSTNLPIQPTPLVGREQELAEAARLLARRRLLTFTGPGGTGKTRLALQLAADVLDDFEQVFFVGLADIDDSALVVPAIAQVLAIREGGGRDVLESLTEQLRGKATLLVLDNVEHVVESSSVIARLLVAAPELKVVATGRVPLRLTGEQEYPVPPLTREAAVELFAERAAAARPQFEADDNIGAIDEICARVDRLPLAIELAAARTKVLPPQKLLERLGERLPLLTGGRRDAPERHQTLRAAIDWSFRLLEPPEQELFAQLSVFAGGFALEAAESVCNASIDVLASLVEKSLVNQSQADGGDARFSMLETVREYARERLEESGRVDAVADAHAGYFLALAEQGGMNSPDEDPDRGRLLYPELDNVRRARRWLAASGDVEGELRLTTAAFWNLWTRTDVREFRGWLGAALERATGADPRLVNEALGAAALAAANGGERELAREYARESLALARQRDDKRQIEWALRVLSFDEPDLDLRRRQLRECEQLLRELDNEAGLGWVTFLLGQTLGEEGHFDRARETLDQAATIFHQLGRRWEAANAEVGAAYALISAGRSEEAGPILEDALRIGTELESASLAVESLAGLAIVSAEVDPATSARIFAAAEKIADESGAPLFIEFERGVIANVARGVRDRLAHRFEREWEAGRALTLEQAVALALGES